MRPRLSFRPVPETARGMETWGKVLLPCRRSWLIRKPPAHLTLNSPLSKHIQRLNKIRRAIPALRKGQYSVDGVSGNGMAGLGDTNDIQTRKMMRRLYVCGDQKTDVGNGIGLIAPRVAACAAHQANKVLQLILQS